MILFSMIYNKLIDVGKNLSIFRMNTISKTHQRFSDHLRNPRVLKYPEEFLGENYEAVLNFWLIIDELSEEQLKIVEDRDLAFFDKNRSKWSKAKDLSWEASKEVVGWKYASNAGRTAWKGTNSYVAEWATHELIGMHKILEDHQQSLTFFPMFLEVL